MDLLILDADGVFMDESPYWKTALAAALVWHGIDAGSADRWEALSATCIQRARLQRIPKLRGCNSNWDLAAIMTEALEAREARDSIGRALRDDRWEDAASELGDAMRRLDCGGDPTIPPLAAFGIDRSGDFFHRVVAGYQEVFAGKAGVDWPYARHALAAPRDQLRSTLRSLRTPTTRIGVCTSRGRQEILGPMSQLGIDECFDLDCVVTHDETLEAERATGRSSLQKPHWFSLLCAFLGFETARNALETSAIGAGLHPNGRFIYVGDAPADFQMAAACRERRLPVEYVHLDSGLTDDSTLDRIRQSPMTLGLARDLAGVKPLIEGSAP